MFFYPVVLPSLEFGIGHDLGFLWYSYTHIYFKFINTSRNWEPWEYDKVYFASIVDGKMGSNANNDNLVTWV